LDASHRVGAKRVNNAQSRGKKIKKRTATEGKTARAHAGITELKPPGRAEKIRRSKQKTQENAEGGKRKKKGKLPCKVRKKKGR